MPRLANPDCCGNCRFTKHNRVHWICWKTGSNIGYTFADILDNPIPSNCPLKPIDMRERYEDTARFKALDKTIRSNRGVDIEKPP